MLMDYLDGLHRYTAVWNITFEMGTNSSASASEPGFCGSPPFSYQSFVVNVPFEVSGGVAVKSAGGLSTVTAHLPSTPTGKVTKSSGALSISAGASGVALVLTVIALSSLVMFG
jgi:hypothetical protein